MEIDAWMRSLAAELGLSDISLDDDVLRTVLDLARDAAHQIDRPAAPLTTFLVGVAVGRGASLGAAADAATALAMGEN
jgi:hypothetical protein